METTARLGAALAIAMVASGMGGQASGSPARRASTGIGGSTASGDDCGPVSPADAGAWASTAATKR